MPGRRNLAREQAAHDASARAAAIHHQLTATLPRFDRALVGQRAILRELQRLGLRRPNGQPVTWRMLCRWRRVEGFPMLAGQRIVGIALTPALTTTYAVTAWILSRFSSAHGFRVGARTAGTFWDSTQPDATTTRAA